MAIHLLTNSIKTAVLVFFALTCVVYGLLFKLIVAHEKEFIYPVTLPFVDPNTEKGFYINLSSQIPTYFVSLIGFPGIETVICVISNNFTAAAAVIEDSLQEFEEEIVEHSAEHSRQYRNIIMEIMDFNRFA